MKKLSNLKLNQLSKAEIGKREMNNLRGGECGCGCHYSGSGGSAMYDNGNTNYYYGYGSYGGNVICSHGGWWYGAD